MCSGTKGHSILRLKAKDAAELSLLEKECFSDGWNADQYRKILRTPPGLSPVELPAWMAFGLRGQNGELDAYICLGVDAPGAVMEICNIAVREQARHQGLGWILLRHALEWGRDHALARCILDVKEGNTAALALYAKAGFQLCSRRKKYYGDTGEDALVMIFDLQTGMNAWPMP